jgi:hypothetical protein
MELLPILQAVFYGLSILVLLLIATLLIVTLYYWVSVLRTIKTFVRRAESISEEIEGEVSEFFSSIKNSIFRFPFFSRKSRPTEKKPSK